MFYYPVPRRVVYPETEKNSIRIDSKEEREGKPSTTRQPGQQPTATSGGPGDPCLTQTQRTVRKGGRAAISYVFIIRAKEAAKICC